MTRVVIDSIASTTEGEGAAPVGGGTTTNYDDVISNLQARWARVAEWRGDLTQTGFPVALTLFSGSDSYVAPTGADFNSGFGGRVMLRDASIPTTAAVIRESDGGGDGNQTLTPALGNEFFLQCTINTVPPLGAGWSLFGMLGSAGSFPFADVWSLANNVGIGRTTVGTDTADGDLEVISTVGTTGSAASGISRATLAGALAIDVPLQISVALYPSTDPDGLRVRGRVRNMVTGVEVEQTLTTNIPTSGLLHACMLHDVGADIGGGVAAGSANITVHRFAVGYP